MGALLDHPERPMTLGEQLDLVVVADRLEPDPDPYREALLQVRDLLTPPAMADEARKVLDELFAREEAP